MENIASQSNISRQTDPVVPAAEEFILAGGFTGVLLVHGFTGSIADLRQLGERLHSEGYSVVGVRLPGHGSTVRALHASNSDEWYAALQRGLASFPPSVKHIVLIGESMGGLLAVLAAHIDSRIVGLVLLAPAFHVHREKIRWIMSRLLPEKKIMKKPWVSSSQAAEYRAKGSLLELTVGAYRNFLQVVTRARRELSGVSVPVIAFFSRDDAETSASSITLLRNALHDRVTIREVPGSSHHLATGEESKTVIPEIVAFIKTLS